MAHNVLEESLIGTVVVYGRDMLARFVAAGVDGSDFQDPRAAAAWQAILACEHPSIVSIETEIQRRGQSRLVSLEYLASAAESAIAVPEPMIRELQRRSEVSGIALAAKTVAELAAKPDADPAELRDRLLSTLALSDRTPGQSLVSPMDAAEAFVRAIHRASNPESLWSPIPTGLPSLDFLMGGGLGDPLEHEYLVIGARPGMGKTAFVISLLMHTSLHRPVHMQSSPDKRPPLTPALFHSLEQSHSGAMMRAASSMFGVERRRVIGKRASATDVEGAINLADLWSSGAITLGLDSGVTPDKVYSESLRWWERQERAGYKRGLVVVDYIEHMLGRTRERELRHAITAASMSMLRLAKRSGGALIPIMLSQLNRGVESRPNKRPTLADLRESGALEEHASKVLFLYRQAYYMRQEGRDVPAAIECAGEIGVAKSRNGSTGVAIEGFDGPRTQWRPLDRMAAADYKRKIGAKGP